MVTSELISYIKYQIAAGITREKIIATLSTRGWLLRDIEEAFSSISSDSTPIVSTIKLVEEKIKQIEIDNKLKFFAIFSYIGILFWIPIFFCKDNAFVKFHIRQGFILFILETVTGSFTMLGFQVWQEILIVLFMFVWVVFSIVGIKNVIKGIEFELPIIGKIALRMSFPHMRME